MKKLEKISHIPPTPKMVTPSTKDAPVQSYFRKPRASVIDRLSKEYMREEVEKIEELEMTPVSSIHKL